jgi:hypothetical protein
MQEKGAPRIARCTTVESLCKLLDTLEVPVRIENKLLDWDEVTFDTVDSCISHRVIVDTRRL